MQFKTIFVIACAGLAIAAPAPQQKKKKKKTQAEIVALARKGGANCNDSGRNDGIILCSEPQSGETCFVNRAGGSNCLL